jgi:CRISPR/Cas system CSM-associated protein Csm3 (group 7 of RAMP superfamily)
MLKRRLCEARFTWRLSCEGPFLIADGRYQKRETEKDGKGKFPDKVFISHTAQKDMQAQVDRASSAEELCSLGFYVPGTSLRGPVRAQAEKILRTVIAGEAPITACDPFEQGEVPARSCSTRLAKEHASVPYAAVCPACRLFGCTGTASRVQISDADIEKTARSVYRDMIGIDRFTGGVYQGEITEDGKKKGGANMRFHALEGASFETHLTITNFELWQLGLLAFVFRDFEEGLISMGFGKTKGFGQVKGAIQNIEIVYPRGRSEGKLQDLYSLATEGEREQYRLHAHDSSEVRLDDARPARLDFFETFKVTDIKELWKLSAEAFMNFVARVQEGKTA